MCGIHMRRGRLYNSLVTHTHLSINTYIHTHIHINTNLFFKIQVNNLVAERCCKKHIIFRCHIVMWTINFIIQPKVQPSWILHVFKQVILLPLQGLKRQSYTQRWSFINSENINSCDTKIQSGKLVIIMPFFIFSFKPAKPLNQLKNIFHTFSCYLKNVISPLKRILEHK